MPLGDEGYFELNASEKKQKQDKVLKTGYKFAKTPSLPSLQERTIVNH